jgi:hypothetical protein
MTKGGIDMANAIAPDPKTPRLTAEALAELIVVPAFQAKRIVYEQKYPKKEPVSYQPPFYSTALGAIIRYYKAGNNINILNQAILDLERKLDKLPLDAHPSRRIRAQSNIKALETFKKTALVDRMFNGFSQAPRHSLQFGSVEVRFSPDLCGRDLETKRFVVFNPCQQEADDEIARMTIELGYHIFSHRGVQCKITDFEYVNLFSGKVVTQRRFRPRTIERARDTAQMVEGLWTII